jgi:hypothetical protein
VRRTVAAAAAGSALLTVHSLLNLRLLRTPRADPPPVTGRVSVLVPARDEEATIGPCLAALSAQTGVPDLEVLVLDDASGDGTAGLVAACPDPRVRLLAGAAPPPGWLGKPYACEQLAAAAGGDVLVFVDADVRLEPHAVAAAVDVLRRGGLDLVCPYPRQVAATAGERLVQPLLQWSWLTTLPLRLAERSARASLTAANGQFLVVDAVAYRAAGGHAAIRGQVLDDIALARAVKAAGGRAGMADGTTLAACRMYTGWAQVRAGYAKSLWSAFGSPAGAAVTAGGLVVLYVLPPLAALRGSRVGLLGYLAAVAGRYAVARRVGGRRWPDCAAHPLSVLAFAGLTADSFRAHRAGAATWRGRVIP